MAVLSLPTCLCQGTANVGPVKALLRGPSRTSHYRRNLTKAPRKRYFVAHMVKHEAKVLAGLEQGSIAGPVAAAQAFCFNTKDACCCPEPVTSFGGNGGNDKIFNAKGHGGNDNGKESGDWNFSWSSLGSILTGTVFLTMFSTVTQRAVATALPLEWSTSLDVPSGTEFQNNNGVMRLQRGKLGGVHVTDEERKLLEVRQFHVREYLYIK